MVCTPKGVFSTSDGRYFIRLSVHGDPNRPTLMTRQRQHPSRPQRDAGFLELTRGGRRPSSGACSHAGDTPDLIASWSRLTSSCSRRPRMFTVVVIAMRATFARWLGAGTRGESTAQTAIRAVLRNHSPQVLGRPLLARRGREPNLSGNPWRQMSLCLSWSPETAGSRSITLGCRWSGVLLCREAVAQFFGSVWLFGMRPGVFGGVTVRGPVLGPGGGELVAVEFGEVVGCHQ
jgi:hypothetical protein